MQITPYPAVMLIHIQSWTSLFHYFFFIHQHPKPMTVTAPKKQNAPACNVLPISNPKPNATNAQPHS
jgi:hypothetical protein